MMNRAAKSFFFPTYNERKDFKSLIGNVINSLMALGTVPQGDCMKERSSRKDKMGFEGTRKRQR
jgi:hypothetical protein